MSEEGLKQRPFLRGFLADLPHVIDISVAKEPRKVPRRMPPMKSNGSDAGDPCRKQLL